jgi:hypothetical protein
MHEPRSGIPFEKVLGHLAQEIIIADAEMQLLQRQGWTELNQGFPLVEGLDHLAYLGLTEVRMRFWLIPVKPGIWFRLRSLILSLFGLPAPTFKKTYRLNCRREAGKAGLEIIITIGRDKKGNMNIQSKPATEDMEGSYVPDLFSR